MVRPGTIISKNDIEARLYDWDKHAEKTHDGFFDKVV
jgi:hypothetical protein